MIQGTLSVSGLQSVPLAPISSENVMWFFIAFRQEQIGTEFFMFCQKSSQLFRLSLPVRDYRRAVPVAYFLTMAVLLWIQGKLIKVEQN